MAATHGNNTTVKMMTTGRRSVDQLTRQASNNLSNYEGYHGDETVSVPFTWESQPGTPKHRSCETPLPPLAPPPSYYSHIASSSTPRSIVKARKNKNSSPASKSNLLQSILPKRTARKARASSPPPPAVHSSPPLSFSSSSSSSSSYQSWQRSRSVPSTPIRSLRKEKEDEEDLYDDVAGSSSNMCFGNAGFRGCYSSMIKKVMLGDFR